MVTLPAIISKTLLPLSYNPLWDEGLKLRPNPPTNTANSFGCLPANWHQASKSAYQQQFSEGQEKGSKRCFYLYLLLRSFMPNTLPIQLTWIQLKKCMRKKISWLNWNNNNYYSTFNNNHNNSFSLLFFFFFLGYSLWSLCANRPFHSGTQSHSFVHSKSQLSSRVVTSDY